MMGWQWHQPDHMQHKAHKIIHHSLMHEHLYTSARHSLPNKALLILTVLSEHCLIQCITLKDLGAYVLYHHPISYKFSKTAFINTYL